MRWKLTAVVVGFGCLALVVLNLEMREDAEPDLTSVAPPVQPRDPSRRLTWNSELVTDPARLAEQEAAEAEEPSEDGEATAATEEAVDCEHPFVPSAVASGRVYRWTQSDQARTARLILTAAGGREREGQDPQIRWRARVAAEDDDSQLGQAVMYTACSPGVSAEEPWFGILERSLGLDLAEGEDRWRWPVRLRTDLRFEGTARFDPSDSDMRPAEGAEEEGVLRVTRRHVVREQEMVEVPAGSFEAWRVEYEETHEYGGHSETGTGVLWVAPNVGMVKSEAENSQGVTQVIELLEFDNPG